MGIGTLAQAGIDLFLGLGLFLCAMKLARAPKDDPRLSRGLQLLQSKIAVLEDLSDRSETQAQQLTALLAQKGRDVQSQIEEAERHVRAIRISIEQSREVARLFEDKIPHHEIIERQNTAKYVRAARLAHQGLAPHDIARQVDLPMGEIEFIAKVNKDRLMFSEDQLPWWAEGAEPSPAADEPSRVVNLPPIPAPPQGEDIESLERLGEEFRRASTSAAAHETAMAPPPPPLSSPSFPPLPIAADLSNRRAEPVIRKVEFRRIDPPPRSTDNLS